LPIAGLLLVYVFISWPRTTTTLVALAISYRQLWLPYRQRLDARRANDLRAAQVLRGGSRVYK
jgi:hypothetical protein